MENEKFYPYDLLVEVLGDDARKAYLPYLDKVLATLADRERECIKMKFFEGMTLEAIGKVYNLTRERIRQIIAKGCRKLRHPSRKNMLLGCSYSEVQRMYLDLKQDIEELHDIYENALEKVLESKNIDEFVQEVKKSRKTLISDLDLSVRSYNCLARKGIVTIEDLCNKSIDELKEVRNLGARSLDEVVGAVHKLGYKLREEEL